MAVIGFAALLTFPGARAVLPPLTYFVINGIEGGIVTPMILGRRLELNPVVIFIALILWGWLWGVIGAFLAVPLVATFKIVCDRVEGLQGFGQLLGR